MRARTSRTTTALLLLLALTGCSVRSGQGVPNPTGPLPTTTAPTPDSTAPSTAIPTTTPPTPDSTAPSTATPTTAPRVTVSRTGGFAGQSLLVTVEPDGRWVSVAQPGGKRSGKLTTAQQSRLRELTASPALASEATGRPSDSGCRDTYRYLLTVGNRQITYSDCPNDPHRPTTASTIVNLVLTAAG